MVIIKRMGLEMSKFVIRGKSGSAFTSTEQETYGQEVEHHTREEAEHVLVQIEKAIPFEEFEIVDLSLEK